MSNPDLPRRETTVEVADHVAQTYFGVTDEVSRRRVIRQCLLGAAEAAVVTPLLFYLRFGAVSPLGWGTTVFFVVYLLLTAVSLYFRPRTEYHSPVSLRGDWLDRVGAFWLVGCAFGPFFGWVVTSGALPITQGSWRWMYGLRVLLAAGVPVMLALPLTRYVRGRATWVALPLLLGVTLLPVSSAMYVSLDLWEGPLVRQARTDGRSELFLKHTGRSLSPDQ
jgi:MFS family permease